MKKKGARSKIVAIGSTGVFLAAFFYLSISLAFPEIVTFKSPLVWRADTQGDYILPEIASPRQAGARNDGYVTYELSPAYTTEGTIETITASYKFKGEVTLEVSADNGAHYTPVVNGVPLTSGFIRGNQLKCRASLGPDSELREVRLAYTDSLGVIGTFGEPRLSGFQFRKPLVIARRAKPDEAIPEGDLFNYQVKIKVGEEDTQTDFKDIRFTSQDGETLLAHYLERIEGEAPKRIATFYVKVPQIPLDGVTIYIYYGNPRAEDLSNGDAVFDFFDGFSEDDLDLEKWEKKGTAAISGFQLKLESGEILTKDFQIKDGIIEYRAKAGAGNEIRLILRGEKEALLESANQIAYSSGYEGAEHCLAVGDIVRANQSQPITSGETYDYRVTLNGANLTFQRYAEGADELQAEVTYEDIGGLKKGYIGLKAGAGCTSYFDRVRVRKYAEPEPEIASSGKEEPTNLARFSGTTLAEDGTLIAEGDGAIYISKVIPLPFQARIIIPSVRVSGSQSVRVDISADRGKTYKTDCQSGSYYYASREDFTPGDELKFKLSMEIPSPQLSELSIDYHPGNILLVSPNGGDLWRSGSRQKILWLASDYEPAYPMRIEYSLDNGKTYNTIIEERENMGVYFWRLPRRLSGKKLIIKVSDALDETIYDTSDGMLEIIK